MPKSQKQIEETKITDLNLRQITDLIENLELKHLKYSVLEKLSLLIIAALGFIVALAWQEALKLTFVEIFGSTETVYERFLYPLIITTIAIMVSLSLSKHISKNIKKN